MRQFSGVARSSKTMNRVEKNDLSTALQQSRWIFSALGIWPMMTSNTTILERRLSVPIQIMCHSLLGFIVFPALWHLYLVKMDMKMKIALLGPTGFAIGNLLKYLAIINRRKEIRECIKQMESDWSEIHENESRKIMMENVEKGKKVTRLCAFFTYTGGVSHQIMVPFLPGSIISIVGNSTQRMLVYPVYDTMFETQYTPVYEIMYLYHVFTGVIICTICIGACHLSILFITHVSGQNEILILKLKTLLEIHTGKGANINDRMNEIIQHHRALIKFSHEVETSLREMFLICIMEALYIICTAQYYSMTAWRNNETFGALIYFILVDAFVLNCFIFCHVGELSKRQFYELGEAAYMTDWHCLSLRNAKAMFLIIKITQKSPKLTAGGLMELSYNGFVTVLKTTAAYFNIMRMVEL